jgi:nucleoside-diphosphate-sugar epimerase
MPIVKLPLDETHPREGGPRWAALRRESEDILLSAGATVLQLPDFFGPHVHTSTLQNALSEAVQGKPMSWIGSKRTAHEFVYVPDAMRVAALVAEKDEAAGERFVIPGSGPITGARLAELLHELLGRDVKLREAGPLLLRIVSLFDAELRAFMPMVPEYAKPHAYDGSKLEALLGPQPRTDYREALRQTLDWVVSKSP